MGQSFSQEDLFAAARHGDVARIEQLLSNGVDVNARDAVRTVRELESISCDMIELW